MKKKIGILASILFAMIIVTLLPSNILYSKKPPKLKVAVIEFEVQGDFNIKDAGKIMAEWMITAIGKKEKFIMVERVLLKKILEEDKLIMSGVVDEGSAQEIGQKYGVDAIITGAVSKWGDIYTVTARLIDTFTGEGLKFAEKKTKNQNKIAFEIDKLAGELIRVKIKPRKKDKQIKKKSKQQLKQEKKEAAQRLKQQQARKKLEEELARKKKIQEKKELARQKKLEQQSQTKKKSDSRFDSKRGGRFKMFSSARKKSKKKYNNTKKKLKKDRFESSTKSDDRSSK